MPSNAEIIKETVEQFKKIQRYMLLARQENAEKTYAELKDDYISLKVILNALEVNLSELDKIKE